MLLNYKTFCYLHQSLNIVQYIGIFPVNSTLLTNRRISLDSTKRFLILRLLNTILSNFTLVILCWILLILPELCKIGTIRIIFLQLILLGLISQLFAIFVDSLWWFYRNEWVMFVNAVIGMTEVVDECTETRPEEKSADETYESRLRKIMQGSRYFFVIVGLTTSIGLPIEFYYDTYILVCEMTNPILEICFESGGIYNMVITFLILIGVMILLWYFIWCYMCRFTAWTDLIFTCGGYMTYILSTKIRLTKIEVGDVLMSIENTKHPTNAYKIYAVIALTLHRVIEITNLQFTVFGVFGITLASFTCYNFIGSSGISGRLEMLLVFIIVYFFLYLYHYIGKVYVISVDVLNCWKYNYLCLRRSDYEYQRRKLTSLRPLRYDVGSSSLIDGMVSIKILDTIVDKTIFLLTGFPLH